MAGKLKADEKVCPQCAEVIKLDARVCRHCGHTFDPEEIATEKAARKKRGQTGCLIGAGVVAVAFVAILMDSNGTSGHHEAAHSAIDNAAATLDSQGDALTNKADAAHEAALISSNWNYDTQKDAMRGSTSRFATVTSDNSLSLPFPYGGENYGHLQIRRRSQDGLQVQLHVDKGQILCSEYTGSRIHLKVDGGHVRAYGCQTPSDGDSEWAFFNAPARVVASLRKSKRAVVELDMFQAGTQQLTFKTAGLVWK